jgi:hypothetical protein
MAKSCELVERALDSAVSRGQAAVRLVENTKRARR